MRTVTQKGRLSAHKNKIKRVLKIKMGNKIMHGQYIRSEDRQLTDDEDKLLWMSSGDLKRGI
jgi:co-chaperonin GroES (HSP10)